MPYEGDASSRAAECLCRLAFRVCYVAGAHTRRARLPLRCDRKGSCLRVLPTQDSKELLLRPQRRENARERLYARLHVARLSLYRVEA